jgi:hypothetical protein
MKSPHKNSNIMIIEHGPLIDETMEQRKKILDLKSIEMNTHIILDLNGIFINKIQQPTHAKGMHKIMNRRCTLNEDLIDCLF